jgi:hypothetical protein
MKFDPRTQPTCSAGALLAFVGFALVLLLSARGSAHTGEYLRAIALHPTNPDVFALRYESGLGGILFSRDGGKKVEIVPGQSFYLYPLRWRVPMLMAADGKLQLALDDELHTDDGRGCELERVHSALTSGWITDLASHPSDPGISFVVTTGDTTGTQANVTHVGLWRRDAQGALTPLGASDAQAVTLGQLPFRPTSLKVIARDASVDGLRFVEGGQAADPASPMSVRPVLRVSDDLGQSWTTHAIPNPDNSPAAPAVLLVSGGDPFRALVALENGTGEIDDVSDPFDPIYVTRDSGQSFTLYLDQIQMSGPALALPSGQILLGGRGPQGGLWSARDFDSAPSKIQELGVTCLAYQATTQKVFMCRRYELGLYDAAANSFCAFFQMAETKALASCPGAPLQDSAKVISQLCNGFCSAQHYAESSLCTSFDVGQASLCGAAAHAYDVDAGYIAPPGFLAAPRCSGFSAPADAGAAAEADAGSAADEPDAADTSDDEARGEDSDEEDDDDAIASEDDNEDEGEDEDAGATKRKKKKKGCACALDARESPAGEGGPLLALGLALVLRLRARARRGA